MERPQMGPAVSIINDRVPLGERPIATSCHCCLYRRQLANLLQLRRHNNHTQVGLSLHRGGCAYLQHLCSDMKKSAAWVSLGYEGWWTKHSWPKPPGCYKCSLVCDSGDWSKHGDMAPSSSYHYYEIFYRVVCREEKLVKSYWLRQTFLLQ